MIGLGLGLWNAAIRQSALAARTAASAVDQPPTGDLFLTDADGAILTDADGAYFTEPA